MKKIILMGGGGHCKSCIDVIESANEYEIVGILDTADKLGQSILDYKIIGTDSDIDKLISADNFFLITVGQIKNFSIRKTIYEDLLLKKANIPTVISKYAIVSKHTEIGVGNIIMHQAVVNAQSEIGNNCIINTKSLIEHDCKIGDNTHVSTGAVVNGGCTVGNNVFIGSCSVINQGVTICDNVVIGAGSVVLKPIYAAGIYVGNPLRKLN